MELGEALARCPSLCLLPANPLGAAEAWEVILDALEGIGAEVEASRRGLAFFQADGLLGLHHGRIDSVMKAARIACAEALSTAPPGTEVRLSPEMGVGPTRFCALAAALSAPLHDRTLVVHDGEAPRWLRSQPVELLRFEAQTEHLPLLLQRLGIRTLGDLLALGRDAIADRFGRAGVLACRLASGEQEPLARRRREERLQETLQLDGADSGPALKSILSVLIERLLANRSRRGRTLRAVSLSAQLVERGTWRKRVVFREPLGEAERIGAALSTSLEGLPAPVEALCLSVDCFGPPAGEQRDLLGDGADEKRARLGEAVVQAQAFAGLDAASRVVLVDPDSRVPERRTMLAPFEAPPL